MARKTFLAVLFVIAFFVIVHSTEEISETTEDLETTTLELDTTSVSTVSETKAPTDPIPSFDDINALKEQLDLKGLEIDGILQKLQGLQDLTSALETGQLGLGQNLTQLMDMVHSVTGNLDALQVASKDIQGRMNSTTAKLTKMDTNISAVQQGHSGLNSAVGGMKQSMNRVNATMRQLHNFNQFWRNNFRLVNTTFRHIRKKVNFPLPAFNLGPPKGHSDDSP